MKPELDLNRLFREIGHVAFVVALEGWLRPVEADLCRYSVLYRSGYRQKERERLVEGCLSCVREAQAYLHLHCVMNDPEAPPPRRAGTPSRQGG